MQQETVTELVELMEKAIKDSHSMIDSKNKCYETFDKDEVRILCDDAPGKYPIVGYFINLFDELVPTKWSETGLNDQKRSKSLREVNVKDVIARKIPWQSLDKKIRWVAFSQRKQKWVGFSHEEPPDFDSTDWISMNQPFSLDAVNMPHINGLKLSYKDLLFKRPDTN